VFNVVEWQSGGASGRQNVESEMILFQKCHQNGGNSYMFVCLSGLCTRI
jgi:hypothetical protein